MIDAELKRRVDRILGGERRPEDLDRLYLGLRERAFGRASVREIGDFVAHRDERVKGPVTRRVRDIFVSFRSWLGGMLGEKPTLEDAKRVAVANLRIVTEAQLTSRLGLRREVAASVLTQAVRKLERGKSLTAREERVFNYLGSAFIWNQAFLDEEVLEDLVDVLVKNRLLNGPARDAFRAVGDYLTLYIITLMHGSAVLLENGDRAELRAGFGNTDRRLEVKATLFVRDQTKPIMTAVCVLWTKLVADDWCDTVLVEGLDAWSGPLEIGLSGRLQPM